MVNTLGFENLRRLNKGTIDGWMRHNEPEVRIKERSVFISRLFDPDLHGKPNIA